MNNTRRCTCTHHRTRSKYRLVSSHHPKVIRHTTSTTNMCDKERFHVRRFPQHIEGFPTLQDDVKLRVIRQFLFKQQFSGIERIDLFFGLGQFSHQPQPMHLHVFHVKDVRVTPKAPHFPFQRGQRLFKDHLVRQWNKRGHKCQCGSVLERPPSTDQNTCRNTRPWFNGLTCGFFPIY